MSLSSLVCAFNASCFRRFVARLSVDVLELLLNEAVEEKAGDEEIGGDALVGVGVVVEMCKHVVLRYVGEWLICSVIIADL